MCVAVREALSDGVRVAEALAEVVTVAVRDVVLVPEMVTTDPDWDTVTLGGERDAVTVLALALGTDLDSVAYVIDDVFVAEKEFQVLVTLALLDEVADTDADSGKLPDQDREPDPVEVIVAV